MLVEMKLARIVIFEDNEQSNIILRESGGQREFPIIIGRNEAFAIDRRVKGQKTPRPLTHDLALTLITDLGARLEQVVVSDLRDHTFFAKLVIRNHGELVEVDSRPSDAIAISAGLDVPIFVAESVLKEVCPPDLL